MIQEAGDHTGSDDSHEVSHPQRKEPVAKLDPWGIVAYLLSGMLIWVLVGWLLDKWLGTSFLVLVGLLVGTGLSLYLIHLRLKSS